MPKTPLLALNMLMILAISYVLYLGIEVLARTAEIFIVILIFFGFTGNLFIYFSGNVDLHNLQPILENGWKPIVTKAFPRMCIFPFAEMLVFTMVLPYLNRPESAKKVWLSALISSGIALSYTTALNIAVLGVKEVERSTFPLLTTIGMVNLFEFIQRLDAIVVFTLLITVFFKAAIYLYGAVIGMADLFKLKNYQSIILPTGMVLILFSMMISSNFAEQTEEGTVVDYLAVPLLLILPLIMLFVAIIRKWFKKKAN